MGPAVARPTRSSPPSRGMYLLWIAAPAVTCTLALGLDQHVLTGRDALAGLALGLLAAGARGLLRPVRQGSTQRRR